jgi:hypothetical protein
LPKDLPFVVDRTIQMPDSFTGAMVSVGETLYLLSSGQPYPDGWTRLSRLDAVTGTVTTSRALRGIFAITTGGGYVWISVNDGPVRPSSVLQLDPTTLATVHSVPLPHTPNSSGQTGNVEMATNMAYAGGLLWVGFSRSVLAIDPATGTVVRSVAQDGEFTYEVAASPNGRTLWTSGYLSDTRTVPVDLRDARTGAVLASTTTVANRFVPTTAGTWVTVVGGMMASDGFLAQTGHRLQSTDLHAERPLATNALALTAAAGVLWLTDYHVVQCADLATGRIEAGSTNGGLPAYGPATDLPSNQLAIVAAAPDTGQQEVLIAHPKPSCRA